MMPGVGLGFACRGKQQGVATEDPASLIGHIDMLWSPRWVWWGRETSDLIAAAALPIDRCWDVLTVHRLLHGTWRATLGEVWAQLDGLPLETLPQMGQLGLLDAAADEGDPDTPRLPNGHLRPEWITGAYGANPERLAAWAGLTLDAQGRQASQLGLLPDPARARSTAHSESCAELLCAEMTRGGLPVDEAAAVELIERSAGPRPTSVHHEDEIRTERDKVVFANLKTGGTTNLRNPAEVKSMLRREGFDLPDTRAWRLEALRDSEPLIDALLTWRKAERIATTYGYGWLDEHVDGGRLPRRLVELGRCSGTNDSVGRASQPAIGHAADRRRRRWAPVGQGRSRPDRTEGARSRLWRRIAH